MQNLKTNEMAIEKLRLHLSRLFDARHQGVLTIELSETRGFIDGYIAALEDLHVCDKHELLKVIADEREGAARRAEASHVIQPTAISAEHFA